MLHATPFPQRTKTKEDSEAERTAKGSESNLAVACAFPAVLCRSCLATSWAPPRAALLRPFRPCFPPAGFKRRTASALGGKFRFRGTQRFFRAGRHAVSTGAAGEAYPACASAKRALKLDKPTVEERPTTPLVSSKKNLQPFSPTTGTCRMSPFSSPRSNNVQEHRNGQSNGKMTEPGDLIRSLRKARPQIEASDMIKSAIKGHRSTNQNDKLLMLHSAVEDSLERFIHIRKNLTSLKALEGIRELENIVGVSDNSGDLQEEVRKTRKLIEKARQQKLLRKSNIRFPTQDYHRPLNSFAFLKSIID
ncbi:centromere protein R isoform X2 [Anolis carolinensis]